MLPVYGLVVLGSVLFVPVVRVRAVCVLVVVDAHTYGCSLDIKNKGTTIKGKVNT